MSNIIRYLERRNHTITLLHIFYGRANFVDDSHKLVTEDVCTLVHNLLVVQVQITATYSGACYPDNDVCGFGDSWNRSFHHADI